MNSSFVSGSPAANFEFLLRGSRRVGRLTRFSIGQGFLVQRRVAPAEERSEETLNHHYILLWRDAMLADRKYSSGRFMRVVKPKGTLSLGSAGILPAVRPLSPYDVIACIIDSETAAQIAIESGAKTTSSLHENLAVADPMLASLVEAAIHESESDLASGKLFGDSLAYVIVNRFLQLASVEATPMKRVAPLPPRRLTRVLERINDKLDEDVTLVELAKEAGFSRAHFIRMFKAATGITPHRHLLERRLLAARDRLTSASASITEIALECGFSSHSHFTRAFRQRFGITPTAYRFNK